MKEPLTIHTRCAHWGWNDHRYFGKSVFDELTGSESLMGMAALSVLGRRLSKDDCAILEDMVGACTLADPRIWPLKLTRLVSAYGCATPGLAAGLAMLENANIGPWSTTSAAAALVLLHPKVVEYENDPGRIIDAVVTHLASHKRIAGFGTPYRHHDERLVAFRERMRVRGRIHLPYWRSMNLVAVAMREIRHLEPNIGLGMAAAMLDLGIEPEQMGPLTIVMAQHMFMANAVESASQASPLLQKLPESSVGYVGVAPRISPRANVHTSFIRVNQQGFNQQRASRREG